MNKTLFFPLTVLIPCFYLLASCHNNPSNLLIKESPCIYFDCESGALIRGDTVEKKLALVFTGDEFADGGKNILAVLKSQKIPGSFFLTGNFYRNPDFKKLIYSLKSEGHYLGAHSDKHLLYCDWVNRDSLLVTKEEFIRDLENNNRVMKKFGISKKEAPYFLPPYEWYNDTLSIWTESMDLKIVNYTPGTLSHADYTTPDMPNYRSSEVIYKSIIDFEGENENGLNGFILLSHIGTAPERVDKFYNYLDALIIELKTRGYQFVRIDELLDLKSFDSK